MDKQGLNAVDKIKKEFLKCRAKNSGGSFWPGACALEMDPCILSKLSENTNNILITGTNGKTTTTHMVVHMLKNLGISCITNRSGANRDTGIITAYGLGTDENGIPIARQAIMECDEKYFCEVALQVDPELVVLTNLSEDQQSRLINPYVVYENVLSAVRQTNAIVCVNDKCECFRQIESELPAHRIIRFSTSNRTVIVDNNVFDIDIELPGAYNYENLAASAAVLYAKELKNFKFSQLLKGFVFPFGRLETFKVENTDVTINLAKNKVGVTQTLDLIVEQNPDCFVVMGFNTNSQDGTDPSWIDTIEWSSYRNALMNAYTYGAASQKTKNTLEKAGISSTEIRNFDDLYHIMINSKKPVFMVLNYTCMQETRNKLSDMGYVKSFWEM